MFLKKELTRKSKKEFPLHNTSSENSNVSSCREFQFNTVEGAYKILICDEENEDKNK